MSDDSLTFHHSIARILTERYAHSDTAPDGWQETAAWHWAQGGAFAQAADCAVMIAEARIVRLDFVAARHWAERTLEYVERLSARERHGYHLRAYAVALAVLEFRGQYREGLEYAERMLRVARLFGGHAVQVQALLARGRMQRAMNRLAQAETTLLEARELAETEQSNELQADARFHLAKVHQLQGRHIEALQELQLAQEVHETADDRLKLAQVFTAMGDIYRVLGAAREAQGFYRRALGLEQGRANPMGQAILKDKLALALLAQDRLDEAELIGLESLQIRESIGDQVGEARSNTVLGAIAQRLGHFDQAIEHHERARALEERTQNERGQHVALLHLGDAYVALERYEEAGNYYRRAHALAEQSCDHVALARALERQGDLGALLRDPQAANTAWVEALRIRESLGHADEAAALRERLRRPAQNGKR